jgi:hypothetical protein
MYLSKQNGRNRVSVLSADTPTPPATDTAC